MTGNRGNTVLLLGMPNYLVGFDQSACFPQLGLASMAGHLPSGMCRIVDLVLVRRDLADYIPTLIRNIDPFLVGLSCMTFQYRTALALARLVKAASPGVPVVMGGYHPTLDYQNVPLGRDVDFVIRCEGERSLPRLVEALKGDRDLSAVPGLSYLDGDRVCHNPVPGPLEPEEISLPDRSARLIDDGFHILGVPADTIESSRGCTLDCDYCCIGHMYGRGFRPFPLDRVIADIISVRARGKRALLFTDDHINLDIGHLERLCQRIIAEGLSRLHYATQASVRSLAERPEVIDLMAEAGFRVVYLGIERIDSGGGITRKRVLMEQTELVVRRFRERKVLVSGGFIVGLPDDDEAELERIFRFARRLRLDGPLFFNLTPYPGTVALRRLDSEGLIAVRDTSRYDCAHAVVDTKHLGAAAFGRLVTKMYDRYLCSSYLWWNNIWRRYPGFYFSLFLRRVTRLLGDLALGVARLEFDPGRGGMRRERTRRRLWLLE